MELLFLSPQENFKDAEHPILLRLRYTPLVPWAYRRRKHGPSLDQDPLQPGSQIIADFAKPFACTNEETRTLRPPYREGPRGRCDLDQPCWGRTIHLSQRKRSTWLPHRSPHWPVCQGDNNHRPG